MLVLVLLLFVSTTVTVPLLQLLVVLVLVPIVLLVVLVEPILIATNGQERYASLLVHVPLLFAEATSIVLVLPLLAKILDPAVPFVVAVLWILTASNTQARFVVELAVLLLPASVLWTVLWRVQFAIILVPLMLTVVHAVALMIVLDGQAWLFVVVRAVVLLVATLMETVPMDGNASQIVAWSA